MIDLALLGAKYLFLGLLYLFLLWAVLTMRRDVRRYLPAADRAVGAERVYVRLSEGGTGRLIPVSDGFSIGRAPGNTLRLDDETVSSRHAMLTTTAAGWNIEDLGSANGTFVDGARISGSRAVTPGTVITIGRNQLELVRE